MSACPNCGDNLEQDAENLNCLSCSVCGKAYRLQEINSIPESADT